MKVFHASDLHFSPTNLVEADKCFGYAVEQAIAQNVEVAIIGGDSTDHALEAHSPALLALAKRIKQLADHCPVFMLQGTFSHEPIGMLKILELVGARHPIIISDHVEMIGLSQGRWSAYDPAFCDVKWDLVITSVPTVNKAELALTVGADNVAIELGNHIAGLLGSFGAINTSLAKQGVPTVLVSHGTVDGSLTESGVPMSGLDHEFTLGSLFSANASAVMLGHIHKHQDWSREFSGRQQHIAYPGSIGRFHYGEIGEKGALIWDVQPTTASFEQVVTPSKRMIDIEFQGAPNMDELSAVAASCAGAFVRVRYQVDEEYASTVDRNAIKEILESASEVKIDGTVLTIQRQRCAGISTHADVWQRFAIWCEFSNTPGDGLAERIVQLQANEAAAVASCFIRSNRLAARALGQVQEHLPAHHLDLEGNMI